MGETRVDLQHLLEDLADAYPGDLEETILTEIVANSLDSGATRIAFTIEPTASTFTAVDNGGGMRRTDLRRFHDIAATSKTRGDGIGFAGVGIKLGLLVSDSVVTESRRGKDHLATAWALAGRQRAPWRWIPPLGMVESEHGTAIQLRLATALSPLLDTSYVETALRHHFEPLFDAAFQDVLSEHYPAGVEFTLNSRQEVVSAQLAAWGDDDERAEPVRHRAARPVERDMERVLVDLARRFPLLTTLVEQRPGGKRRIAIGRLKTGADGSLPLPLSLGTESGDETETPAEPSPPSPDGEPRTPPAPNADERVPPRSIDLPASRGPKRPGRLGLTIQYESRADDASLGRLVESTVWINDAHPAYRRAVASRSEGYHLALTVAMTLSTVAVEAVQQHAFVTAFLARWGEAVGSANGHRRRTHR